MVCYARPASLLAAIVAVAWLVFSGPVSHFFSTAAVLVAVLVATDPGQAVTGRQAPVPVRSVPVFLPMPEVPRWPDRPLHRVPGQARAGSAACSVSS